MTVARGNSLVVPGPPTLPNTDDGIGGIIRYLSQFASYVKRELGKRPEKEEAQGALTLVSSGGKTYTVTVDDAGVITTALVYEET